MTPRRIDEAYGEAAADGPRSGGDLLDKTVTAIAMMQKAIPATTL